MSLVLDGLQQELIQYNGKLAEPIDEINQRFMALQKLDAHNIGGVWDSNDGLFAPMVCNAKNTKKFNQSMWSRLHENHQMAETQIKQSMLQLEAQIHAMNQMKRK